MTVLYLITTDKTKTNRSPEKIHSFAFKILNMKKSILLGLSLALFIGAGSSCKKTSKRKIANSWTIQSITETTTTKDPNMVKIEEYTYKDSKLNQKITIKPISGNNDIYTSIGESSEMTFKIRKDGTWEKITNLKLETNTGANNGNIIINSDIKRTASGTWNFLGKIEKNEFKKNERIIFNTLVVNESLESANPILGGANIITTNNNTYSNGEMNEIYVVSSSKKKELILILEKESSEIESDGTISNTTTINKSSSITLIQE